MKAEFFLRKIKNELPELKWKKYKLFAHGWDHSVIILDNKLVFRFPKEMSGNLHDEIQLLHYLKDKIRVGIPNYFFLSDDKSLAGYKLVEGRELKLRVFDNLSALEKNLIAQQLAEFLSILHEIPYSAVKKYHVRRETPDKLYNWQVRDLKKFVFPRLNKKDVTLIKQYLVELKFALGSHLPNALKHGDLTWDHLLWDKKKKQLNIIDFSDRAFGDPASDFSGLWAYGPQFVNNVYDLYTGKKDKTFLYRSQLYFKRLPLFLMKDSLASAKYTFKKAYLMFKKRFK